MSDDKMILSEYAKRTYNASGEISKETTMAYLKALLVIASADGEVAEQELAYWYNEQRLIGTNEEYLEELKEFDWKNTKLEDLLSSLNYDFEVSAGRVMLYQAIKMSRADSDYHKQERAAVFEAAKLLNIDEEIVHSLEALVEMEANLDRMRYVLLGTSKNE